MAESAILERPGKIIRIGTMTKQLLEELRRTSLDETSRSRLREMYELSISELSTAVPEDLREELTKVTFPFTPDVVPSESELRVAEAQLAGWLEGLFQGIQAAVFAQQMAAQSKPEHIREQENRPAPGLEPTPGVYL